MKGEQRGDRRRKGEIVSSLTVLKGSYAIDQPGSPDGRIPEVVVKIPPYTRPPYEGPPNYPDTRRWTAEDKKIPKVPRYADKLKGITSKRMRRVVRIFLWKLVDGLASGHSQAKIRWTCEATTSFLHHGEGREGREGCREVEEKQFLPRLGTSRPSPTSRLVFSKIVCIASD